MALPLVELTGSTRCPEPVAVADQLATLLPPAPPGQPPDQVQLGRVDAKLHLRLLGHDGRVLAERSLPADDQCAELAAVVAVVVAAWEAELRPGIVAGPSFAPEAPGPAQPSRAVNVTVSMPGVRVPASPARPSTLEVEIGSALLVTLAGGQSRPGGAIESTIGRRDRPLALRLAATVSWPWQSALGEGQARWARPSVALGARYRALDRRWIADGHAGLVAGWLLASGAEFPRNRDEGSFSPAAEAGLRVGRRLGTAVPWLGFIATRALVRQELTLIGGGPSKAVPVWMVGAAAGVSVGF